MMQQSGGTEHPPAALLGNFLTPLYVWVVGFRGWRALAFTGVLGAVANLAFPPVGAWPALVVALTGLVWSLDAARLSPKPGWSAFWRVFAFGFTYFLVGLHWIAAAFLVDPGAHLALIWLPLTILPAGLAAILAGVMTLGFRFWCPGPARIIIFAVFFTLAEWVRGALFGLGGLPWNLPGMVWAPGGAISQSASVWGVYGLSMLTVAALCTPAALTDGRPRGSGATRAAPLIVAAIVFGAIWGWGARRLDTVPELPNGQMVRLVEAGAPQNQKYEGAGPMMVRRFVDLTGDDGPGSPSIVIWPEGALPYYVLEHPEVLDIITGDLGGRRLIFGTARQQAGGGAAEVYNSLAVVTAESNLRPPLAVYDKHMLVPFGEFTPLREVAALIGIETLQRLASGGFTAGERPDTVMAPGVPAFAPLICYEAIFPGLSRSAPDRPAWLVNISNDSWFGNLSGPYQHSAQARYRAIEEGLPMARVAAGGHTGMIDAYGRWTARGEPADPNLFGADPPGWTSSIVDAAIPPAAEPTPYSRWRDGLFWLILLGFNLGLLALPRR
jgi:apolipoprotein N-acyltransferase